MANVLAVGGSNSKYKIEGAGPAGFWAGLWHGFISPITFIVSLFNPNVCMYEGHNKGRLYEFGFLLGVGAYSLRANHYGQPVMHVSFK